AVPVQWRHAVKGRLLTRSPKSAYEQWIAAHDTLSDRDRALIRRHIAALASRPRFSILMPVYNTPAGYLREAIESVCRQLYPDWELCIVDDASTQPATRAVIRHCAAADPRIRLHYREVNGGISAATNTALAMAQGDWIAL